MKVAACGICLYSWQVLFLFSTVLLLSQAEETLALPCDPNLSENAQTTLKSVFFLLMFGLAKEQLLHAADLAFIWICKISLLVILFDVEQI